MNGKVKDGMICIKLDVCMLIKVWVVKSTMFR